MNLEKEILKIIKTIEITNARARDFLSGVLGDQYNDPRYCLWFQKEFADALESISNDLRPVSNELGYAEPTRCLLELRDELVKEYDEMYDLFEKVSEKIRSS